MLHWGTQPYLGPAAALAGLLVVRVETPAYIRISGGHSTLSEVALPSGDVLMAKSHGTLVAPLLYEDSKRWMEF